MYLFAGVNVTLRDVLGGGVEESAGFFAGETWLEKYLRATETFGTDSGDVWGLCVVIHANVAQFLFDITTNLLLCDDRVKVPALSDDLVLCVIIEDDSASSEAGIFVGPLPGTEPVVKPLGLT